MTRIFRVSAVAGWLVLPVLASGDTTAVVGSPGHHSVLNEDPADTEALLAAGAELAARLNSDAVEADIGFRVTQACYDKWGPGEFQRILYGAVRDGTRCLLDLQEKGKGDAPNGVTNALKNALALEELRRRSPVNLTCDEDGFDWEENQIKGLATLHDGDSSQQRQHPLNDPRHPFVTLNPRYPLTNPADSPAREKEIEEISALLFHEHLHNLSHAHGEDIEYSSACEHCCFSFKKAEFFYPEGKALACQICTGNYRDQDDPRFLRDMLDYATAYRPHSKFILHFTRNAKAEKRNPEALLMLSRAQTQQSSPVGSALALMVQSRHQGALSPYALKTLGDVEKVKPPPIPDEVDALAESVAEAYRLLYGNHDSISTLRLLLARKDELRRFTMGRRADYSDPAVQRVAKALEREVKTLLDELSLNRFQDRLYPPTGSTTSQVAEELYLLLFPDDA